MGLLNFKKIEKKEKTLTIRIRPSVVKKLKSIKKAYSVSQSGIIEQLINKAHEEMKKKKETAVAKKSVPSGQLF